MDENQNFEQWRRELSKRQAAGAVEKMYVVNPNAVKVLTELIDFFKTKLDEEVQLNRQAGLECRPYTMTPIETDPWCEVYLLKIATDLDWISLNAEQFTRLSAISNGMAGISFFEKEGGGLSILLKIKDFYLEVKPVEPISARMDRRKYADLTEEEQDEWERLEEELNEVDEDLALMDYLENMDKWPYDPMDDLPDF